MIPYGLLSGIVDGQEVRITQLGENGFVFRMANQAEKIHEIWLQFFSQNGGCYKKLLIPADRIFYRIYGIDRRQRLSKICASITC